MEPFDARPLSRSSTAPQSGLVRSSSCENCSPGDPAFVIDPTIVEALCWIVRPTRSWNPTKVWEFPTHRSANRTLGAERNGGRNHATRVGGNDEEVRTSGSRRYVLGEGPSRRGGTGHCVFRPVERLASAVRPSRSPVTCRGLSFQRKQVRKTRSSIGWFSMTSAGATKAARIIRAFPPSTT